MDVKSTSEYYEQMYVLKFDNLGETDQLLEINNLQNSHKKQRRFE